MWSNEGFGFNSSQAIGGGGFASSQTAAAPEKKNLRSQNLMAVTAKRILQDVNKQVGILRVGDTDVSIASVAGVIRAIDNKSTCITYQVDDGTDCIEVRQFKEAGGDENDGQQVGLTNGASCKVFGSIRNFDDKICLVALRILPITNQKELQSHKLEAERNFFYYTKHDKILNDSTLPMETSFGNSSLMAGGGLSSGGNMPGLNTMQQQVYNLVKNCRDDSGISVYSIMKHGNGLSEAQIRLAIEFLSTEGHVYSTIDDDHYKSTDG